MRSLAIAVQVPAGFWRNVSSVDRSEPIGIRTVAIAALGMGVPVVAGVLLGKVEAGFIIGLGAILLAGSPTGAAGASSVRSTQAILPALFAVVAATAIAGTQWTDVAVILLAGMAGVMSGYSRPMAGSSIQFIIYLTLSAGFLSAKADHRETAALIFGSGVLWNVALRAMIVGRHRHQGNEGTAPSDHRLRLHFRKTIRTLGGWQFPLRLMGGLAIASGLGRLWPHHHFHWIMLTVALLTQRPVEHVPVKTVQRLFGTIGGVALAAAILVGATSPVALVTAALLLATLLPLARSRSYLLYSIVATPLILLVLDVGRPVGTALLADRLIATFAGGSIIIVLNVIFDHLRGPGGPSANGVDRARGPAEGD